MLDFLKFSMQIYISELEAEEFIVTNIWTK